MGYNLGIDVGSTTVKFALMEGKNILYKSYQRHFSRVYEIALLELHKLTEIIHDNPVKIAITGSAGLGMAEKSGFCFVQEVYATTNYIKAFYKDINVVIELGGEDAKIVFLEGNVEERMNSTCAGGTGSFIDQMSSLLNVTPSELDALSLKAKAIYPIASRCGVFAKTDIQPLINQGADKENIAASIYQAVVDQTITGLAQGRAIKGKVLFLGGPLSFSLGLRKAFVNTLKDIIPVFLDYGEYFIAFGASFYASKNSKDFSIEEIISIISAQNTQKKDFESENPLFEDETDYNNFINRHSLNSVDTKEDFLYNGDCYLGIDAGSTTTKMTLIDDNNRIIFNSYQSNKGSPLDIVKNELLKIYNNYPNIKIKGSCVTGYGEELIKSAFLVDIGQVETVAHYTAAKYFEKDVDFIIDIGGQDMKCFGIKNGLVDSVILNEACSSGCGSFIETFASSLGYLAKDFAKLALKAKNPVNLGSRCTVFMNSSVKQAQKNGATVEDISAGLALSVVKNALYKVLRINDARCLGDKIVVQGGTFLNDAVLRSFEKLINGNVIRPNIAGLMGAFGCAIIAKSKKFEKSSLLNLSQLNNFTHISTFTRCGICPNRCSLTVNSFSNGNKFISGNRCERPTKKLKNNLNLPNLYNFKQTYFKNFQEYKGGDIKIGIPFVLNFYDTLPFWFTFFKELGFSVKVSKPSDREVYRKGQDTISSDTICYGAKIVHGHIISLIDDKVDAIFYPSMSYNFNEKISDNFFHCPVVAYYPEVIKNNIKRLNETKFLSPYLALNDLEFLAKQLTKSLKDIQKNIKLKSIKDALKLSQIAQNQYRTAVLNEGARALTFAKENNLNAIVLAGRPYHVDNEINHGIDSLISSLDFVVLSEDSLPIVTEKKKYDVLNQWTYHARMYAASEFVKDNNFVELVQLVSFGCGLDAVTGDEIKDILTKSGRFYTQLKIDEISNLGAVKIRIRSLLAAINDKKGIKNYE